MGMSKFIANRVEGTRMQDVWEAFRRSRWPKLWRIGRKDHEALMICLPLLLKRDSNCVDVGANRADLLEYFVKLAKNGSHVAFEPLPHHADYIRKNFPAVTLHQLALSDQNGQATFFQTLGDDAYSGLKITSDAPRVTGTQEIPVRIARLDDMLPEDYRVDLLKIDVEGAELGVLRGAQRTLNRYKPVVVFEFQKERAESYGDGPVPYWELLVEQHHYSLFRIDGIGPLTREEFLAVYESGDCFNFIARQF